MVLVRIADEIVTGFPGTTMQLTEHLAATLANCTPRPPLSGKSAEVEHQPHSLVPNSLLFASNKMVRSKVEQY